MEEERRLAFVALTRARKGLFLSDAEGRSFDGAPRYPSRFILDIDQSLLNYTQPPQEGLIAEARSYIQSISRWVDAPKESALLQPGTRVQHVVFGPGTIEEVDQGQGAYVIRFDGISTPRRISVKAKIETL